MPTCLAEKRWCATSTSYCPARPCSFGEENPPGCSSGRCRRNQANRGVRPSSAGRSVAAWKMRSGAACRPARRLPPLSPEDLPMVLAELYGDGANLAPSGRHARERSYLRAHLKCYDDLEDMLTAEAWEAAADAQLEERLTPHFQDPRWQGFISKLQAINV